MCAVAVEYLYIGTQRHLFTEHSNDRPSLHDSAAERVLGLKADDENRVPRIRGAVQQVMEDPPAFDHAGSGDHDQRTDARIQPLGFLHAVRIRQLFESKELLDLPDRRLGLIE